MASIKTWLKKADETKIAPSTTLDQIYETDESTKWVPDVYPVGAQVYLEDGSPIPEGWEEVTEGTLYDAIHTVDVPVGTQVYLEDGSPIPEGWEEVTTGPMVDMNTKLDDLILLAEVIRNLFGAATFKQDVTGYRNQFDALLVNLRNQNGGNS